MASLSFPPATKHATGRLSRASIPAPEIPRSLGSAPSHHHPLPRGWRCRWEPGWLHHTLCDAGHSPRRSGLASGSGDVAAGAANTAAHCSTLTPGRDEQGVPLSTGWAWGSCWGCQHPLSPQPSRTPMLGGGFLPEAGWLAPPSPLSEQGSPGCPTLSTAAGGFSQMSSQCCGVTPDMQELLPQGPFPTIELCLISLH